MLNNLRIGSHLIRLDQVDSTNSYLKRLAAELQPGTVVVAAEQTLGRGRGHKRWSSRRHKSLTFSILLSHAADAHIVSFMHLFPAVAIVNCLRSLEIAAFIKWPNDIILRGKKIGGILVEAVTRSRKIDFILGIGLNVNEAITDFPEELRSTAGSLASATKKHFEIDSLLHSLLHSLNVIYPMIFHAKGRVAVRTMWCDYCGSLNGAVTITQKNADIDGKFVGLDKNGFAVIKQQDKQIIIRDYDHVSLREIYDTCN